MELRGDGWGYEDQGHEVRGQQRERLFRGMAGAEQRVVLTRCRVGFGWDLGVEAGRQQWGELFGSMTEEATSRSGADPRRRVVRNRVLSGTRLGVDIRAEKYGGQDEEAQHE